MLKLGQKVTLSGETVEGGIDDVAIVDGLQLVPGGYTVILFFPNGKAAQ